MPGTFQEKPASPATRPTLFSLPMKTTRRALFTAGTRFVPLRALAISESSPLAWACATTGALFTAPWVSVGIFQSSPICSSLSMPLCPETGPRALLFQSSGPWLYSMMNCSEKPEAMPRPPVITTRLPVGLTVTLEGISSTWQLGKL